LVTHSVEEFLDGWLSTRVEGDDKGMVLMIAPALNFYEIFFQNIYILLVFLKKSSTFAASNFKVV